MCRGTISKSFQHLDILVQLLERDGVEFTLDPTTRRFASADLGKAELMGYLDRSKAVASAQRELTEALCWWGQHDLGNVAGHAWKGHMTLSLDRVAANCVEDPPRAISALGWVPGTEELQKILSSVKPFNRQQKLKEFLTLFQAMDQDQKLELNQVLTAELRVIEADTASIWTCSTQSAMGCIGSVLCSAKVTTSDAKRFVSWMKGKRTAAFVLLLECDNVPGRCRNLVAHTWEQPNAIRFAIGCNPATDRLYIKSAYPVVKK